MRLEAERAEREPLSCRTQIDNPQKVLAQHNLQVNSDCRSARSLLSGRQAQPTQNNTVGTWRRTELITVIRVLNGAAHVHKTKSRHGVR